MVTRDTVEEALHRLYIGADGASLRTEDRKKASELVGFLAEIENLLKSTRGDRPFHLVDAAAGKAYVGLLAAEFFLAKRAGLTQVTLIERETRRAAACRQAALGARVGQSVKITVAESAVETEAVWPVEPDLVVALHACGAAADAILDRAVACGARHLLLVPCCTSAEVAAMPVALRAAERIGMPRHAEVRRRFVQSLVDAERTLRLEAAGYETQVVSFVPPTTTPHNLLWRARRVNEPVRRQEAASSLERLRAL
jgi:hypothetical protein